jgi:transcriptional regulator with XRE-family HTH domain
MPQASLINRINGRMHETGATQSDLARACGMSQPHLSKVLRKKVKLASKTAARLERWLLNGPEKPPREISSLESISAKVAALGPKRRIQFMQLLDAIDSLLGG